MEYSTQSSDPILEAAKWLGGAAAGALLMYLLDPERGSARRASGSDKIAGLGRQTGHALGSALHSAGERLSGAADSARDYVTQAAPGGGLHGLGDTVARAGHAAGEKLGGSLSRIEASVSRLGHDAGRFLSASGTPGDWAPAARSSAVMGGGLLGLYGLLRRSPLGWAVGLAGLALLARGATNRPLRSMVPSGALEHTYDLERTIRIDASPEEVYDLWANYENFPRFMSHVIEVRDLGHRRSHWMVEGPAGSRYEWDAVLTEQARPSRLAWRSEPGAEIAQSGSVQFEPSRGATLVTVRMSYTPPAGVLGHGIAVLLGADPKRQMDEDLMRMKTFIERGALPVDAGAHGRPSGRFLH